MFVVIKVDEFMIAHLPESSQGYHNKNQANQNIAAQDEGLVFDNIHMLWDA